MNKFNGHILDVDYDEGDIAEKYEITSVPTSIIEEAGKEIERFVGALSKEEVLNKLV